jgi:hypothetical protein
VLLELSISSYIADEFDIFLFKSCRFVLTSSGKFSLRVSLPLSLSLLNCQWRILRSIALRTTVSLLTNEMLKNIVCPTIGFMIYDRVYCVLSAQCFVMFECLRMQHVNRQNEKIESNESNNAYTVLT